MRFRLAHCVAAACLLLAACGPNVRSATTPGTDSAQAPGSLGIKVPVHLVDKGSGSGLTWKDEIWFDGRAKWRLNFLARTVPAQTAGDFTVWDGHQLAHYDAGSNQYSLERAGPNPSPFGDLVWSGPSLSWKDRCDVTGKQLPNAQLLGHLVHHFRCGTGEVWVDAQTGLVLKLIDTGRQLEVTDLQYDPVFPPSIFAVAAPPDAQDVTNGTQTTPRALHAGISTTIPVGAYPGPIGFGASAIWAVGCAAACDTDQPDSLVYRIDPATNLVVATIRSGTSGLAADDSSVWVTAELNNLLLRINPATNRVVASIGVGQSPHGLAIGEGGVWTANFSGSVTRVDPGTNKVAATISLPSGAEVQRVAVGFGSVWAPSGDGRLLRINPNTNKVSATIAIPQDALGVAVGEGAVWVDINPELGSGTGPGSVVRIDPTANKVMATMPVGHDPNGIAVGDGVVWVANQGDGTVTRIDPQTNAVIGQPWNVGTGPAGIVFAAGAVWVANNRDGTVVRINL